MRPMVFLICLLCLLTRSTAYGGNLENSLTQRLSGIAGDIKKGFEPINKIPNMVVQRFNGATNSIAGMVNGAAACVLPPAAAKNAEKPLIGLSMIAYLVPFGDVTLGQTSGGIYKNGSVILNRIEERDLWGNPTRTTVMEGMLKDDMITMKNGDRGMLNKSAQVVVIGSTTYLKN